MNLYLNRHVPGRDPLGCTGLLPDIIDNIHESLGESPDLISAGSLDLDIYIAHGELSSRLHQPVQGFGDNATR